MQPERGHVSSAPLLDAEFAATCPDPREGGGAPVAPWQEEAVQPDLGQVMVLLPDVRFELALAVPRLPPVAGALALEPPEVGGGAPVAPWQEEAVQPDLGQVMVEACAPVAEPLAPEALVPPLFAGVLAAPGGGAPVAP